MKIVTTMVVLAALYASPAAAAFVDIVAPEVTIVSGDVGVVQADLTWTLSRVGITLENRAGLQLNGHMLDACAVRSSVSDSRAIEVLGPGLIRNAGIILMRGGSPYATS